jgi:hypothetical protein
MSERGTSDAEEVRTGHHFRDVALSPVALGLLVLLGAAAAVGGSIVLGVAGAAGAAGLVLALWLMITAVVAGGRARTEFFSAYASKRGLRWTRDAALPPATPLLRMGDGRKADEHLAGTLPGGLEGAVALYTYEERQQRRDPSGQQAVEYHHFTIALCELPESRSKIPALYAQRRFGFRFLDGAEDVFRSTERITLESEKLDSRCEIFADPDCDANWLRQLFSPSFVVFLAEETPEGFAFEVENGMLCVNVRRHAKKAKQLDELCAGAQTVANRIREELAE